MCYFLGMNIINVTEIDRENTINQVCDFLKVERPNMLCSSLKESIKKVCVARLCKAIGVSKYNYKSDYFNFFSSIMGEALCEKLAIKTHIACDELRLVRYNNINLVSELKHYLDNETVEEAFLDAFDLIEQYKFLIPKLKKV